MQNFSKNTAALALLAGASLFFCACTKTTEAPSKTQVAGQASTAPAGSEAKAADKALVRFINGTPEPRDLSFGDLMIFSSVAYKTVTPYKEVPAERHEFKVSGLGATEGLATESEGLRAGQHYSILVAAQPDGKITLNAIHDDLSAPPVGKAKVRVINAAPASGSVDVYAKGTDKALISGAGFGHATEYREVDPMTTELDIRRGGSKRNEARVTDVNLSSDKLYTVVIMGGKGQPVTAETVEDQLVGPVAATR
jgi:hypothetical protein